MFHTYKVKLHLLRIKKHLSYYETTLKEMIKDVKQ